MKKSNSVIKTAVKLLISSAIVFLLFYLMLPPINPLANEFWIFLTAVLVIYLAPFCFGNLFKFFLN